MNLKMETSVTYVKGVGPARAEMLRAAGIESVEDLLSLMPMRYEDRESGLPISALGEGDKAVVKGKISASGNRYVRRRGFSIFEVLVSDGGGCLSVKFFNQPYLAGILKDGRQAVFFGEVSRDKYGLELTMLNPEVELLEQGDGMPVHSGRIVPVYRRIDRISGRMIRQIIFRILSEPPEMVEILPAGIIKKYGFPGIEKAFLGIHFPLVSQGADRKRFIEDLNNWNTPAQKRMAYGEFFLFQAGLKEARTRVRRPSSGRNIRISNQLRERVRAVLPFRPTTAQKRVLREIVQDIASPYRMNRLLQGDVGSGKTIVALQAMIVMMESGFQAAFMAPTELLAEQHFRNFSALLQKSPYKAGFLSSSVKGTERKRLLESLASGETQLAVGTHSLIQEGVSFKSLGLAVIDEQHRFGVVQRTMLAGKGYDPDILVMTATPIPRSLAMTLYGDLDISLIDELPPGREPVKTLVKTEQGREEVYALVREKLKCGEQVFVVCPLIEESEQGDLNAATEMHGRLREAFDSARIGLLHGRMGSEEKQRVMLGFRDALLQVLVTTTVVEVGIDVPAATVMIVEHAERFGLSQLHQLRGRVGRGRNPGLCVLMASGSGTRESVERLQVMCRSNDGFVIAEKDLEIRGPGDYLGVRQSGAADFHFGSLVKHYGLLAAARQDVSELFDGAEISPGYKKLLLELYRKKWGKKAGFFSSG